jgi:hypothetical protein
LACCTEVSREKAKRKKAYVVRMKTQLENLLFSISHFLTWSRPMVVAVAHC